MADKNRMNRVDEQIKEEVSKIISLELQDPHLTGMISVTKVKTTPDFRYSRVFVSMIGCKSQKDNLATLKKSSRIYQNSFSKKASI